MTTIAKYPGLDPSVSIPHLVGQDFSQQGAGAFLLFDGYPDPIGVRSQHRPRKQWTLRALFSGDDFPGVQSLLDLFATAFAASDARLLITPSVAGGSPDDHVNEPTVVEVHQWDVNRQPGSVVAVSFTAVRVAADPE